LRVSRDRGAEMSKKANRKAAKLDAVKYVDVIQQWGNRIFGRSQAREFQEKFLWPFYYKSYRDSDLVITLDFGGNHETKEYPFRGIHPTAAITLVAAFVYLGWTPEEFLSRVKFVGLHPAHEEIIVKEIHYCEQQKQNGVVV
jgi:hypothetical protein